MTRGSRSSSSPSSRPATPRVREVDRLAYRVPREAARALGLSPDAFDAHVRHDVTGSRSSSSPSSRPATQRVREVDRLAYRVPREAAQVLGLSPDAFDAHVRPDVKVTRIGRIVLVARAELQAWLDRTGGRIRDEVTA